MSYNPFIKIDDKELAKLTFKCEFSNYLYNSESRGLQLGSLFETDEDAYNKICTVLEGNDTASIKKKDRVYVLPGNNLPRPRIKEYLKSIGAYLTTDITKATVIAGNDNITEDIDDQAKIALMMFEVSYCYTVNNDEDDCSENLSKYHKDIIKNLHGRNIDSLTLPEGPYMISNKAYTNNLYYNSVVYRSPNPSSYFMYPATVKAVYEILSKGLPVLNQEYFTKNAHSNLSLSDPEVYGSIASMLDSNDTTNTDLGVEVLVHAKIDNTPLCKYHIWQLARNHNWEVSGRKSYDKNVKYFLNISDWSRLYTIYQTSDYVDWAFNNDALDKELFRKLLPEIYKEEVEGSNTEFYEIVEAKGDDCVNICFTLKEKWINYLKQEENDKQCIEEIC